MKTTIEQITAGTFIALLLLVGNVKATETKVSSIESNEITFQLENWMTDESIWDVNSVNIAEFVLETETSMELEDWMTNDETWNTVSNFDEPKLTVEPWMVNNNIWE